MPVMASTNIRDPRLNAQKRPSSRSPDGSISSTKRHAGHSQVSEALALASSLRNGVAPKAPMSPTLQELSAATTVERFFDAAVQAAELRLELKVARSERDKTSREFQNVQSKFSSFPAIKEQKTEAKTRALQKVSRIERQIEDAMPEQEQVLSSLASLLDYSKAERSASSEVQSLKTQVGQLQGMLVEYSKRLGAQEHDFKDFKDSYSVSEIPTRLKKLEGSPEKAQAGPSGLQRMAEDLETKKEVSALGSRIGRLETEMSSFTNVTSDLRRQIVSKSLGTSTDFGAQLTDMESRIKQIGEDSASDKDLIGTYIEEEVAALRKAIDNSKADVKREVSEESVATNTALRQEVEREILAIKTQYADGSKVQGDCIERLKKLEAAENLSTLSSLQGRVEKLETAENLSSQSFSSLQGRLQKLEAAENPSSSQILSSLQGRMQKLEDERSRVATQSTPVQSGSVWQPVLRNNEDGASAGLQINGNGAAGDTRLNTEVEMLKRNVTQITTRINNLTTDDVVRQMVDQMSVMYPDARNFQKAIVDVQRIAIDLRANVQSVDERLASLNEVVTKSVVSDLLQINERLTDLQAKVPEDMRKLPEDVSRLTKQQDAARKGVQTMSQTINKLAGDMEILLEDSKATEERMKTVASLQTQVLKLADCVANLDEKLNENQPDTQQGDP